ncbi:response regulator transcription factor [uncultured Microscilla sp.]|uniref:response regulator n=1 Tax=uncultured Microscilla sp. TaxID=432653 RepID=UPI00261A9FA4|nr:response regulator transcription factor [uncultured Microscilla sp.]
MNTINIAIVDYQQLFREGLTFIIHQHADLKIALEAKHGKDLLNQLEQADKLPEVILMDIKMPQMDGMECAKILKQRYPKIKIIILTVYDQEDCVLYLLDLGINGYLRKLTSGQDVCKAIRTVYEKGYYFDDFVTQIMLSGLKRKRQISSKPKVGGDVHLTPREREVLALILKEYTTQEIASQLFVSIRTVETHRKNLLTKFGVKNVVGLVVKALQMGEFSVAS